MKYPSYRPSLVVPKLLILTAAVLCWTSLANGQSGTADKVKEKAGSAAKAQAGSTRLV